MSKNYTVANLFLIKKDKAAFRSMTKWLSKKQIPPEIPFLKSVSSIITHIVIEMENSSDVNDTIAKAEGYRLDEWVELQLQVVRGEMIVPKAIARIEEMLREI